MSDGKGLLAYMGTQDPYEVADIMSVLGTALHFAAAHPEQFAEFAAQRPESTRPAIFSLPEALSRAHELVSPSCREAL